MSQPPVTPSLAHSEVKFMRRAMIVDDDEDSVQAVETMLRMLEFETEAALDGIEALRRATVFRPDLLLLDINMPKLDGYDTCGVIRAQPWAQHVRLIAITGYDPEELRYRAKKAGFDAWLLKPVDFNDLRRVIMTPAP